MCRHLLFFIMVLMTPSYGKWQPETPVKYSTSMKPMEASEIIKAGEKKVKFDLSDFNRIEEQAESDRDEIALGISRIDTGITRLIANRQSLIKLRDLEEMKTELQAKRKNYAEMKRALKDNLAEVSHKGLWLVVIDNVSQFSSKEDLRSEAEGALAPKAIAIINGTFIESFTQIANNQTVQDYIRAEVSGALRVENIHQQIHRRDSNKFIYLAQISVSSLKSATNNENSRISPSNQSTTHIIDMTEPIDLTVQCSSCGLNKEDQDLLFRNIDNIRTTINVQNRAALLREKIIVNESSLHLTELAREIELLENNIENRDGRIRKTILQLTNKSCTDSPDDCIAMAIKIIDGEIDVLQRNKLGLKSTEIITQRTQIRPETINPALDVAISVAGVVAQINKSFGKLEQFLEVTEVNNFMLTNYSTLQKQDVFRQADSVWVFYSGQHDETFQILIAVKFRVSKETWALPAKGATIGEELWQDYQKYHADNPQGHDANGTDSPILNTMTRKFLNDTIKIIAGVRQGIDSNLKEGKLYIRNNFFSFVSADENIEIPIRYIEDIHKAYFKYVEIRMRSSDPYNEPYYFRFTGMSASEAVQLLLTYLPK